MERRDTIYDNLRDLKFEYRAGKFAEQDYEQMHQSLENEAALVLAEIEIAAGNQGTQRRRDADVRRAAPAGAAAKAADDSAANDVAALLTTRLHSFTHDFSARLRTRCVPCGCRRHGDRRCP